MAAPRGACRVSSHHFTLGDPPFATGDGAGVTVAVIDSGIHGAHPHVGGIAGGVVLTSSLADNDVTDRIGHGTAVAAAIHEKAPRAALLAVKVFDRTLRTTARDLARGIVWAADQGAQLINLSLGTTNEKRVSVLVDAVHHATARGALVVSVREHDGMRWLPGSLAGVIGVRLDLHCDRHAIAVSVDGADCTVAASGSPRPIPGVPPALNLSGVSFAVANVSGFLARLLSTHAGIASVEDLQRVLGATSCV